jgi:hypothetical protein
MTPRHTVLLGAAMSVFVLAVAFMLRFIVEVITL